LAKYVSSENDRFQPMNANFGILPELDGKRIRDKKERYAKLAERSLEKLKKILDFPLPYAIINEHLRLGAPPTACELNKMRW